MSSGGSGLWALGSSVSGFVHGLTGSLGYGGEEPNDSEAAQNDTSAGDDQDEGGEGSDFDMTDFDDGFGGSFRHLHRNFQMDFFGDEDGDVGTLGMDTDDLRDDEQENPTAMLWDMVNAGHFIHRHNHREEIWMMRCVLQSDEDAMAKIWAANQIALWCQSSLDGRRYKDELRRQGVVEAMVNAVSQLEEKNGNIDLRDALFRALAETVYDHRQNAELAAEHGLLKITCRALSQKIHDDGLAEHLLCVTNNVIGMCQSIQHVLNAPEIIPVLVKFASEKELGGHGGQQIATAALANLSNNPEMREHLIRAGAITVLSSELRQLRPEDNTEIDVPSVSYMQSLSALVKIVGGGTLVGRIGPSQHEGEQFVIDGDRTSAEYDQGSCRELISDKRSISWMLQYLQASVEAKPYPAGTNIYGTSWKVALSVTCLARGSAANRRLLLEAGVWPQLFRTLQRQTRDRHEQGQTEHHVVMAMRAMLRSLEDVELGKQMMKEHHCMQTMTTLMAIAEGKSAATNKRVRGVAADLLTLWGMSWHVERLLWIARNKGIDNSPASRLQPSMIRHIIRHYVMLGVGQ